MPNERKIEDFQIGELVYTVSEDWCDWIRGYVISKYDHLPPENNVYTIKAHDFAPTITRTARQVFRTKNEAIELCVRYIGDEIAGCKKQIAIFEDKINRLNADKTISRPKET